MVLAAFMVVAGCTRGELPVHPHEAGNVISGSSDMGATYKYQVYYDLGDNREVGRNLKTSWDLAFEATSEGFHVVLNTAKSMVAMATTSTDFASVAFADTAGFSAGKKWDSYSGSVDSTAIGDWRSSRYVYIIDRGYDDMGMHQGWAKVQFLKVTDTSYSLQFSPLNNSSGTSVTVKKDSSYNFAFFSLTDGAQVKAEPPKYSWDIVFTQYLHVFYNMDPAVPYLVAGCLLNRYNTHAYADTVYGFEGTHFGNVLVNRLSSDISVIGYRWKMFDGSRYTVVADNNYIIRDAGGVFYKLHFTGFYNHVGIKGCPQFAYQKL